MHMRKIDTIIIHCADTPEGRNDNAEDIRRWHVNERGYRDIGYHYIIDLDGTIEHGRDESVVGAHCRNHNATSIGVCYIGGRSTDGHPKDTRTIQQREALTYLVNLLLVKYPSAKVYGHHDFDPNKACPCFNAKTEYN